MKQPRLSIRATVLFVMGSITATFLVAGVLFLALIRDTQINNTKTNLDSHRTLEKINDCTDPGGDCFERGQKRTAKVVEQFLNGNRTAAAAAAYCASRRPDQTYEQIYRCTVRLSTAAPSRQP